MVSNRSSGGISWMSAFARVVFPEPVAPLTRMFLRAGTATLKNSGQSPASRSATNRASTSVRPLALARVIRNSPAPASWSIGRVTVDGVRIVKEGQPRTEERGGGEGGGRQGR